MTEFLRSGAYARGDRLLQIKVEGKTEKPRFLRGSLHSMLQTTESLQVSRTVGSLQSLSKIKLYLEEGEIGGLPESRWGVKKGQGQCAQLRSQWGRGSRWSLRTVTPLSKTALTGFRTVLFGYTVFIKRMPGVGAGGKVKIFFCLHMNSLIKKSENGQGFKEPS